MSNDILHADHFFKMNICVCVDLGVNKLCVAQPLVRESRPTKKGLANHDHWLPRIKMISQYICWCTCTIATLFRTWSSENNSLYITLFAFYVQIQKKNVKKILTSQHVSIDRSKIKQPNHSNNNKRVKHLSHVDFNAQVKVVHYFLDL